MHQLRHRWHRTERAGQLSWPQWFLLRQLDCQGPARPHTLAERLGVSRSTMTELLDVLEQRGFVRRDPDPQDRRSLQVRLTPAGREVLERLEAEARERYIEALMALEPAEADALVRVLQRWVALWSADER